MQDHSRHTGLFTPAPMPELSHRFAIAFAALALIASGCSDDPDDGDKSDPTADAGPTDTSGADSKPGDDTSSGDAGGGGADGGGVTPTSCPNPLKPSKDPGEAVCVAEPGKAGKGLLISADVLLPGKVIEGGQVLVGADGNIACVGCDCAKKATDARWVVCKDAVVSPGLIDAHNHVGWLNGRPWVAKKAGVDEKLRWEHRHDWRKGKRGNPSVKVSGGGANPDQKAFGELRYIITGSTAIFGSGDLSGLMRDLDRTGKGDNGLNQPGAMYQTFPLGDSSGLMLKKGCGYPKIMKSPGSSTDSFAPHVSEGIDPEARNEFLCMTGQGKDAVKLLDKRAALIHGVGLKAVDFGLMASKGMDLIWSPRSNVSLYGETARVVLAKQMGVSIGLGADWVPSGSINMLRELQCAAYLNDNHFGKAFTDDELWQMATIGAARALAMDDAVGLLKVGHAGDLAVYAKAGNKAHGAVVNAKTKHVALVVRGGEVLAGNDAVISKLEPTCEKVGDVCGIEKGVCVEKTLGKSYKSLLGAIGTPNYPLFFCATPVDEPSCVPARELKSDSVNGSSNYAGKSNPDDKDGDGIANKDDNCPTVFNPVRPLDDGKQADADGDGKGDSCDVCPLDKDTDTCTKFDPNDPDGDGKPSTDDNCPDTANKDQADGDKDGKGDACDECPKYANPGGDGCLYDVKDLKTKADLMGKRVAVKGLVVTASANKGIFTQKNGATAADHSGIFMYLGVDDLPKVGEVIDVKGATLGTFYGQKQLTSVDYKVNGDKGEFTPRVLDMAAIKQIVTKDKFDSPHDGLIVQVKDAKVTNDKPKPGDGDKDGNNEFEIEGGLRVDDSMWPIGTPFITPFPKTGQVLTSVTGPLSYRNSLMKVLPRDAKDVILGPAEVLKITPESAFQFVGKSGTALPQPVTVHLDHPDEVDVMVEVTIDDPAVAKVIGGPFTIKKGDASVHVPIEGLKVGQTKLRAKVKGGKNEVEIAIKVIDPNEVPAVAKVTPDGAKIAFGLSAQYTVQLSNPAPKGGVSIDVAIDPTDLGMLPAAVTVTEGKLSATFTFKAGSKAGSGTITAKTKSGSATAKVDVVDPSSLSQDIGGWSLIQTDSGKNYKLAAGSKVSVGGYVIVARKASKADFEKYWGVTLAANVLYINSGDKIPSINGKETFTLKDAKGNVVDGPTIAMDVVKAGNYQRKVPIGPAKDAASWKAQAPSLANATPGKGQGTVAKSPGLYISEFSDAKGSGKYVFEFVELHYPGPK